MKLCPQNNLDMHFHFTHCITFNTPLPSPPLHSTPPPGAQIIDLMMLVVDITKGIQTQTAEVSYYSNSKILQTN